MNKQHKQRSNLTETLQTGLPTWTDHAGASLALPEHQLFCDRFFYDAFGDCALSVMIYCDRGERLVHPLNASESSRFPDKIATLAARSHGPGFVMSDAGLVYVYDRLDRWTLMPDYVAFVAIIVERDWFATCTGLDLTSSEFELVGLLLSGHDLTSAAAHVGARYDTKRKQVRLILEKAEVSGQPALLRELVLALSSHIFNDLFQPGQGRPEVDLARQVYGHGVVIHSISLGASLDIPVWEFGARRGQPILYFHSMLAPIMFTKDLVAQLEKHNLRLLMIPRHFFRSKKGAGTAQRQILQAACEIVDYFCEEPVICMGESAGCAWAAQFTLQYPDLVSEVVFVATPQAIRLEDAVRTLSSTVSLLTEISTRIRQDERVIAGLTRVYNAIARVPSLARRSLDFMLRQAPSDLASIDTAFSSLALGEWVRLIANKAARASIDEVAHLHSDWVKNLQQLSRPMRFFHGAEDTLCPIEDAKAMACDLRNAQFTTFQGAGHLVLGQRLDAILGALFVPQNANDSVTEQSV
jgi:pimeloyl-ACP methyl ester carboxylesterase